MTVEDFLRTATKQLKQANIPTARLDCLVLLEDTTRHDKSWLLAHSEHELQIETVEKLNKQIARRATHEPLAYIRGKSEFYGREFTINHHVLEPRPESEAMIDLLKQLPLPNHPTIADIGTGSGALAITAKLELPQATVIATDIDSACLKIARKNAHAHNTDIACLQGNLLEPLSTFDFRLSTLLCNLPYVPANFHINPAAMHEPPTAIFGGPDGLDAYRKLFEQIKTLKNQPTFILTEALPPQHEPLTALASIANYKLQQTSDFIQLFTNIP